jgi:hypothetical protein
MKKKEETLNTENIQYHQIKLAKQASLIIIRDCTEPIQKEISDFFSKLLEAIPDEEKD